MPNEPATEAVTAYGALVSGIIFPSISEDVTTTTYDVPAALGILYDAVSAVDIDSLTDTTVGGTGAFDKIMTSLRNHLKDEYTEGRITGREYAEVYQGVTVAALSSAVQFLFTADTNLYQNALIQMQARTAEVQNVIARTELVRTKHSVVAAQAEAENIKANYALTKMNIGVQDITYSKIEQDVQIGIAQETNIGAQTALTNYQVSNILPEEKRKLTYEIDNVLVAAYNKANYEFTTVMPAQKDDIIAGTNIKIYQHQNILPAQENLLQEQYEVQRAQTLDTRSDEATAIAGAIGKQKELYSEQILSYQKDARYKAAKIWSDSWIAQKSLDEGLLAPNQFTNTEIDEVLQTLKSTLNLGSVP